MRPDRTKHFLAIAAIATLALARVAADDRQPINPVGIAGSLVICGEGEIDEEALRSFVLAAKEKRSRIVVIESKDSDAKRTSAFIEAWRAANGSSFQVLRLEGEDSANSAEIAAAVAQADGVWMSRGTGGADSLIAKACAGLLERGGVIGGDAGFAAVAAEWIPDAIVTSSTRDDALPTLVAALAASPSLVGYRIGSAAALLVRGRRLRAIGDGEVSIHFAPSATYSEKTIVLSGRRRVEDLTTLRRIARQRRQARFPLEKPEDSIVKSGTLIAVGGGGMPHGLLKRFVKLAGGSEASIVIIPISMPEPLPKQNWMVGALMDLGAKEVEVLTGRTPEAVSKPESVNTLNKATGIWFGGGRQWRFIDAYEGTKVAELMHAVLRRGGVIAGSSAGASVQGEYMARGNPLGPNDIMADGYERGLAFLGGVAIDQHFTQRRRFNDLSSLVDRYPQLLGIGIDEGTAIVVQGRVAEVVGRHRVCFYDRRKPKNDGEPDFESVPAGKRFDLVERRVLGEDDDDGS